MAAFHFLTRKYINPYKLIMVFGKKGSGKTTLMVRLAYQYLANGWEVYCTERLDGCHYIDYNDIGFFNIPPRSVLLVDEVGMIWDNRNFKNFKTEVRDWFKLQRHYKVKVFLFSQTFDIDKKLRDLTDEMYLCTNLFRVFSWAKRIRRRVILTKPQGDAPARIDEELQFDSLLFWLFGSRVLTFIPAYAPFFNSHGAPKLPEKEYEYLPPLNVPKSLKRREKTHQKLRMDKKDILLRWGLKVSFCVPSTDTEHANPPWRNWATAGWPCFAGLLRQLFHPDQNTFSSSRMLPSFPLWLMK